MRARVAKRRAARVWVVLALGIVLAVAAASARPITAARPVLRYPSKCINDAGTHRGRPIFSQLHRLGVRVWSNGISWAKIARRRPKHPRSPGDPAYRWPANFGRLLDRARAAGIEPVLYVNGFPSWSNGDRDPAWTAQDPQDYANFMAAAVRRYPQVRRWIVFSEPSNYVNFRPQGDNGQRAPRLYARMLDASYTAMHAVRRNVVVIGGNVHPAGFNDDTTTAPDTFLQNMVLPSGRRPRLDMFGINPYTERPLNMALPHLPHRVDFDDLDWLLRQLDRDYPGQRLRLFVDEFGWNTEHSAGGWLYVVSRQKQAAQLPQAFRLAARLGRVDTMCWFQLYDSPPEKRGDQWWNWTSGLRTFQGVRKPSWSVFARVPSGPSKLR